MSADTTEAPPVADIAELIGGMVTADNQIIANDGALIYCNPWGVVKLQRFGFPVIALGSWHDVAGVVEAYRVAVTA